jgi:hypothetical protein
MQQVSSALERKPVYLLDRLDRAAITAPSLGLAGVEYERAWQNFLELGYKLRRAWQTKKTGVRLLREER